MQIQTKCSEKSTPCGYRVDGNCIFWEKAVANPSNQEKVFPNDPEIDLRVIDTLREPCLEIAKEPIGV